MAYVAPTTRADGYVVDAAEWNKNTVDNPIAIKTGTVVLDLVSSAGLVDLSAAAAGQIKFPATQNASANANTLDDYEEGTWTPTITGTGGGSGQVYSLQIGNYVKVGRMVTASFNVALTTLGTVTTAAVIGGLPFTSENVTNARTAVRIGYWVSATSSFVFLGGFNVTNTTQIQLFAATAAATGLTAVVQGDLSNTFQVIGEITYMASA